MPGQYNIMYPVADLNAMKLNLVAKVTKRIARKKGQHQNSPSHSDLYTDENPKGTIHGLKFATVQDAKDSVKKIETLVSHTHTRYSNCNCNGTTCKSYGKKNYKTITVQKST